MWEKNSRKFKTTLGGKYAMSTKKFIFLENFVKKIQNTWKNNQKKKIKKVEQKIVNLLKTNKKNSRHLEKVGKNSRHLKKIIIPLKCKK